MDEGIIYDTRNTYAVARVDERWTEGCEHCEGEGYIFLHDDKGYAYTRECSRCVKAQRQCDLFNRLKLPSRFARCGFTLEVYKDGLMRGNLAEVQTLVKRQVASVVPLARGFGMVGNVGTGKTHLMCAAARYLSMQCGFKVRFIEFTHLLADLKASYQTKRGNSQDIMNQLAEVDILMIDELGKGMRGDWRLEVIDEIISRRYNTSRTTCWTSNYPLRSKGKRWAGGVDTDKPEVVEAIGQMSLEVLLGDRIVSRLAEVTRIYELVDVPDFRSEAGNQGMVG